MYRFMLGLLVGFGVGYLVTEYWLKRQAQDRHEQEDLIEIDQIPLPKS